MRREDITDFYIFIKLWAPLGEDEKDEDSSPFYPYHGTTEGGGVVWKLGESFDFAAIFRSEDIAKRIIRSVSLFKELIEQGWSYEVIKVTEEIIATNIEFFDDQKDEAAA